MESFNSFYYIVAIQAIYFLVITYTVRQRTKISKCLLIGASIGVPLGAVFDLMIGKYGTIFHYIGVTNEAFFMILNSLFSYGLAAATVVAVAPARLSSSSLRFSIWMLVAPLGAFSAAVFLPLSEIHPLFAMVIIGGLVVISVESFCLCRGFEGNIVQLFRGRPRQFLTTWIFSIGTGIVYETGNYFFPLWVWNDGIAHPVGSLVPIVIFGYYVLFIPIFVLITGPWELLYNNLFNRKDNLNCINK